MPQSWTRRNTLAAMSALALSACGSTSAPSLPTLPRRSGRSPRFDDSDPVAFNPRAPQSFPVHGVDAARFQGFADWSRVAATGVRFAWLKATEGGDRLDPEFQRYWRGTKAAGIPTGAYHFYYFCTAPEVQARWFIRNVPRETGGLPPVIDLEWNPFSPTCTLRPPAEEVRAVARRFMDILAGHYGQRPVIYCTPDFWETNDIRRLGGDVWLRSTAQTIPERYAGFRDWRFWQYSGTGLVDGVENPIDLNCFNGSSEDFANWRTRRSLP